MTRPFPETPDFTGFNEPMRLECDIYDLVVAGEMPREIPGSGFRLTPDPQYPPLLGYEAGGLASREVAVCVADPQGRLVREQWFEGPYCALMHDFAGTQEHIVFPFMPMR